MNAPQSIGRDPSGFYALITGLGAQVHILLGVIEHPISQRKETPDLEKARVMIGQLEMLRDKTRGNLDEHEETFFEAILSDVRMRFVEASKTTES